MDHFRSSMNDSQEGLPPRPSTAPRSCTDMSQRPQIPHSVVADVKPRLTKEQHDILEAHFQQQHKPSTNTKKGFADTLGVPLDKINNWFQNRRAKVKQDLKKQMAAYNLYQQGGMPGGIPSSVPMSMPMSVSHQQYTSADMYGLSSTPQSSTGTPANLSMEHLVPGQNLSSIPQHQFALHPDFSTQSLASINEAHQQASFQDVIASMMAAGYNVPEQNNAPPSLMINSVSQGFPENSQFAYAQNLGVSGDVFDDNFNVFGDCSNYDLGSLGALGSTSMQAMNSRDSLSSKPSTTGTTSLATTASSNAVSSVTSGCSPMGDESQDGASISYTESREESTEPREAFLNRKSVSASSSHTSLPQWAANQNAIYQQQNGSSSQTLLYSPLDANADLEPPPVIGEHGVYARRNSSTANLVDDLSQIGIQNRGTPEASFKQPSPPLSIAARRQRHPAALGTAALRSASYTSGMPVSPSAGQALNAEHSLRRIRSSGIANGRVHKPTPTSAQRSPLALNFAEAAASPKFARHTSFGNAPITTANGTLAPPTPLTPSEMAGHFPPYNGSIKTQYASDDVAGPPENLGLCWSADQSSAGVHSTMGSPPKTPMDAIGMNHVKFLQHNATLLKDTPPLSAPPTQLNFPRHMQTPSQSSNDGMSMGNYPAMIAQRLAHMRKTSLQEGGNPSAISAFQYGLPLGNLSSELAQGTMSRTKTDMINQYMAALNGHDMGASIAPPMDHLDSNGNLDGFYGEGFPSQAIAMHHSNPDNGQPKNYVFANQGPKDYQG